MFRILLCATGLCSGVCSAVTPGPIFTSVVDSSTRGEIDGMTVDATGNTYLTGWTHAAGGLKTTPGVVQPQYPGGSTDIFVAKLDPAGKTIFATFWGGPGDDEGLSIAVDPAGNVYVAGISNSKGTYPTSPGAAFSSGSPKGTDGFVLKLNPTATVVIYSTLVPGAGAYTTSIAADSSGNAYFAGTIQGSDNSISATSGALQASHIGVNNPVVVKFGPAGSLQYASFLGNDGHNEAGGIAVDAAGNAYVSGYSDSASFPVTPGAYAPMPASGGSAFVAKLNPQASSLIYSTFIGPGSTGRVRVDAQGNAYVFGIADTGFPTTAGAFDSTLSSPWNTTSTAQLPFIAKLNPAGTNLIYASLFAGASRFDVDSAGSVYVAGYAAAGLPVTPGAFRRCTLSPQGSTFVAQLNPAGQLSAASYTGGSGYVDGLAVGPGGVYFATTITPYDYPWMPSFSGQSQELAVTGFVIGSPNDPDLPCLTEAIENGASFQVTPVVPGELVTLRGTGIGPLAPAVAAVSPSGRVSGQLGGTLVYFNGIPGPVLYAQSSQVNVQVPWEIAGDPTVQVQVAYQNSFSSLVTEPVANAGAALFQIPSGSHLPQGAILNQDGTLNSPDNPAAAGSVVSLFGTGGGPLSLPGVTGAPWPLNTLGSLTLNATVLIDFLPDINRLEAQVVYAGTAPTLISGVFQLNVRLPAGLTAGVHSVDVGVGGGFSYPTGYPGGLVGIWTK